nr:PREDICTED: origin recognition complex subunit 2-like isoform X1 [Equus przewalskii]XP_008509336.1 PREDICTED: origin recognition complex subunit 2-like isoform X1 [Equus przewalskii]
MSKPELKEDKMLEVQFVGDDDVLNHILDREGGAKLKKERAQLLVNAKKIIKKPEYDLEEDDQEVLKDQNYVEVLGQDIQGPDWHPERPRGSILSTPVTRTFNFCTPVGKLRLRAVFLNFFFMIIS